MEELFFQLDLPGFLRELIKNDRKGRRSATTGSGEEKERATYSARIACPDGDAVLA